MPSRLAPIACLSLVAACHEPLAYQIATGPRDWTEAPALVSLPAASTIYAVSDVHGGYTRLTALLAHDGIIADIPASPDQAQWTGGDAVLVVTGDMIDKGPDGLDVIDLLRVLQSGAAAQGGRVIALLGNHETEFFADPTNSKAEDSDGVDAQLDHEHIDLVTFASGVDPRGRWLREQPFGARIGAWFFSHAGYTKGRTFDQLDATLREAFETDDFKGDAFVGGDSLFEARDWFGAPRTVDTAATALGVRHFVFGHTPGALGPTGRIAVAQSGALFRIDCGMSPDVDHSDGTLLRVLREGSEDVAVQLDASGGALELWRGP